MRHLAAAIIILFCTTYLGAQNVYDEYPERVKANKTTNTNSSQKTETKSQKQEVRNQKTNRQDDEHTKLLTGFTGGMKLHMGYAFANKPEELFCSSSLNASDLPTDGVTMGLGGELRLHFIQHVHVGAEGGMSIMPMKNGSSIRTGWGGVMCDYYGAVGKVQLCIGGTIGGGNSKRLYVPQNGTELVDKDGIVYNALFKETTFFLLDPYVGLEAGLSKRISLLIKIDYMLPMSDRFLYPSGPRLYVGVMFGRHDKASRR